MLKTTGFLDKSQYDADKQNLKKIENVDNEVLVYWLTAGSVKRLMQIQKLQKLKLKYLVLLV